MRTLAVTERWRGLWLVRVYQLSGGRRRLAALVAGDLGLARRAVLLSFLLGELGSVGNEGAPRRRVRGDNHRAPPDSIASSAKDEINVDPGLRGGFENG